MLHAAIYGRLAGDAALAGDLATWKATAAIFSGPPIPEDADLPAVIIEAPDDEVPEDTKTTTGRRATRAITVYDDATGDVARVERIAARVVALFHRQPVGPAGSSPWRAVAYGPVSTPTDGTIYARRVVLEMTW